MKVRVYYNRSGRIVSIVELKDKRKAPPAGIFPIPDCNDREIALTASQAKMSLIALHTGYRVDLTQKQPRLIPLTPGKDKRGNLKAQSED